MSESLWHKIATFVHGAAVTVSGALMKIFGKDAAEKFAQGALSILKTAEGKIALDAVEAVQALALTASEKRSAAFDTISADLRKQGLTVADSMINLMIETAVAFLKGNFAPA